MAMPLHSDFSIMPPMPRPMPAYNSGALMAALQTQPPRGRVTGSQNSPSTVPTTSLSPGSFSDIATSGLAFGSAPSPGTVDAAATTPSGLTPAILMRGNSDRQQSAQLNGEPSLSHPVDSYPYRPSSVPLQEIAVHSQPFNPMHTIARNNPNNPYEHNAHYPLLTRPSNHNPSTGVTPAISAPRHVPHAHQLLALFSEAPADAHSRQ
jgi:hypothetical protein